MHTIKPTPSKSAANEKKHVCTLNEQRDVCMYVCTVCTVSMYVCMYVCIGVCICVCVCVCIYICIGVRTYVCARCICHSA